MLSINEAYIKDFRETKYAYNNKGAKLGEMVKANCPGRLPFRGYTQKLSSLQIL